MPVALIYFFIVMTAYGTLILCDWAIKTYRNILWLFERKRIRERTKLRVGVGGIILGKGLK